MVRNRQLETTIATKEMQFKVGALTFVDRFIIMSNLANLLIGLLFLQRNGTLLDRRQGFLNFPSFSMQLKDAKNSYPDISEPLINQHEIILQPGRQSVIYKEIMNMKSLDYYNRHNTLKPMKYSLSVRP